MSILPPPCAQAFGGDAAKCANQPVAVKITVTTPNGTSADTCAATYYYSDTGANIPTACSSTGKGNHGSKNRGKGKHAGGEHGATIAAGVARVGYTTAGNWR